MTQDENTVLEYERLSYFEKEDVIDWIEENLSEIPIVSQTKKTGLAQLVAGNYQSHAALLLIRYAMKALLIRSKL